MCLITQSLNDSISLCMKTFNISGIPNLSSAAHFVLETLKKTGGNSLFVVKDDDYAGEAAGIFRAVNENFFGLKTEILPFDLDRNSQDAALKKLYENPDKNFLFVLSEDSLKSEVVSREAWRKLKFTLSHGQRIARSTLLDKLSALGYSRTPFVENPGEFAMRGSVADFFNYGDEYPVRIYLGDDIESIKRFEISTQRTFDFLMEVSAYPGKAEPVKIGEAAAPKTVFSFETGLTPGETGAETFFDLRNSPEGEAAGYFANIKFNFDPALLSREITRLKKEKYKVIVFSDNAREALRVEEFFSEHGVPSPAEFAVGRLGDGFVRPELKLCLVSAAEIFSRPFAGKFKAPPKKLKTFKFTDLNPGDFIVHEDYGIGKYLGIRKIYYSGHDESVQEADCLDLEYARGDKLLVPLYEFKKVQKYTGSQGKAPKLSHMDTRTWREIKEKVKKEIQDIARDLLKLEAARLTLKTEPLPFAGELEKDFEAAFPYEETEDQLKAITDALADLEKNSPMNRVVVGDVGFGKTEVAMRAAARSVLNGRQAAVLCPTTILAEQHYRTFTKRFEGFPVRIEVISRLTPASQAKKIIADLRAGLVDVIIGTHKLLQKDIKFSKLGLLIIDEEHKFGVKDKEKLKGLSHHVHILMLSATPIPRTLYQSLSTLKTMSVIESPPFGRLPVYTKVADYDEDLITKAVSNELSRGGQIYYVYNRVETIENKKGKLLKLMPHLRIAVIHGRMGAEQIEKTMMDFLNKDTDMLLASTIIESGLDIPSVNTLIVENAHALGLAQLYQLRGRIGREKQKAYCFLFLPSWLKKRQKAEGKRQKAEESVSGDLQPEPGDRQPKAALNEDAVKRLMALEEFSELGSGFRLAMRDLEIRGAGELLGVRQHGFINSIGLDMYIKLLNSEIGRLKGRPAEEEKEITVDLKVPAYIPQEYINDDLERLNYYKKLLNAAPEAMDGILKELRDISGAAPEPLQNLARVITLKRTLKEKGLRAVIQKEEAIQFFFEKDAKIDTKRILNWQEKFGERLRFFKTSSGDGFEIKTLNDHPFELLKKIFS